MKISEQISLLPYNTFGIDVKTDFFVEYDSLADLQAILTSELIKSNRILPIGAGSNLLFLADFKGVVLHSNITSITIEREDAAAVYLEVGSGVVWDDLVAYCVTKGWGGMENLSLIPGEVGAAAVQNIGAYGVEVQDVIVEVNAVEVETGFSKTFSKEECLYGYRDSVFKNKLKGKYVICSVLFCVQKSAVFQLNYPHLEAEVLKNGVLSLSNLRQTIITIRESKLPDTKVQGNAGSFFMNPVLSKKQFVKLQEKFPLIPHYFISETEEKVPAAWLIDQCGWKGEQLGNAAVHTQQALVLVNRGGATGMEIVALAEKIQTSVLERFGVELHAEVNYIS
jgi:UDP-N-acetylmuramate dehydrogenase